MVRDTNCPRHDGWLWCRDGLGLRPAAQAVGGVCFWDMRGRTGKKWGPFGPRFLFSVQDYRNLWQVLERHAYDVCACFLGIVPQDYGVPLVDFLD